MRVVDSSACSITALAHSGTRATPRWSRPLPSTATSPCTRSKHRRPLPHSRPPRRTPPAPRATTPLAGPSLRASRHGLGGPGHPGVVLTCCSFGALGGRERPERAGGARVGMSLHRRDRQLRSSSQRRRRGCTAPAERRGGLETSWSPLPASVAPFSSKPRARALSYAKARQRPLRPSTTPPWLMANRRAWSVRHVDVTTSQHGVHQQCRHGRGAGAPGRAAGCYRRQRQLPGLLRRCVRSGASPPPTALKMRG